VEEIDSDEWEEVSGEEGEGEEGEEGDWVDMGEEDESEAEVAPQKAVVAKGKGKVGKEKEKIKEKEADVKGKEGEEKEKKDGTPRKPLDSTRILTDVDFEKLNTLKEMKAGGKISLRRLRELTKSLETKQDGDDGDDNQEDNGPSFIDPSDLLKGVKAARKRGDERMAEVLERRKEKVTRHKEKTRWTTNEEKVKHKNMMMLIKGKMYRKAKISMRDQQIKTQAGNEKFRKRRFK